MVCGLKKAADKIQQGTMGNLGMYASGIPSGMMIDAYGPRWGVVLGIVLFGAGYYPIAKAFDAGPGVYSVAVLCLFSFFTGAGSCSAFSASIKAAALSYPESRGTATAFPLAAFGLSAVFFATVALALPHDTSHFLLLLATGTVLLPTLSLFFLRTSKHRPDSLSHKQYQKLHYTKSNDIEQPHHKSGVAITNANEDADEDDLGDEHSSLISSPSPPNTPNNEGSKMTPHSEAHLDVRGMALLRLPEFWQLFIMLGLLCGIGLMTINNIGNMTQSLWLAYDPSTSSAFIAKRQVLHVSLLSLSSFTGRLLSGIGSDILVSRYNRSRYWCLFLSACIFTAAQTAALTITYPVHLFFVSTLTGLAYGILFGVYPSLVAHAFGVPGMSQNWGTMILAAVLAGNTFNLFYGTIFDKHSIHDPATGHRECQLGKNCYQTAFYLTLAASALALLLVLYTIRHENRVHLKTKRSGKRKTTSAEVEGDGTQR